MCPASTRTPTLRDLVRSQIEDGIQTKQRMLESMLPQIEQAANWAVDTFKAGKKLLFFGNGGSASDAQHLAAEFVVRYEKNRRALPAIALTTDASILTAASNDFDFAQVFSRQIEALGQQGDLAFAITTSGNSENVLKGLQAARERGVRTVLLTGRDGGRCAKSADLALIIPSTVTSRIQESHILIGHILCDWVDRSLFA